MPKNHGASKKQMLLNITSTAKEYLTKMTEDNGTRYVYLNVKGGGCSGFKYEWNFTDETDKGTLVQDILVLDTMAEMFVFGCTVDYIRKLSGNYLTVLNPNAKAKCGCGESFGI
jgi:iron-sulfur cluster assembly accessory protein